MPQIEKTTTQRTAPMHQAPAGAGDRTGSHGSHAQRVSNPMMAKAMLDIDAFFASSKPTPKAAPKGARPL